MPKRNILLLLDEIETGYMREELFWNVIEDIMNLKVSHNKKMSLSKRTKESLDKLKTEPESNKENLIENHANLPLQPINCKQVEENYECSP